MPPSDRAAPAAAERRMRCITGVLRPVEAMHPVERTLAEAAGVTPKAIHQLKLLDTGTCIVLLRVRGDLDRLHDLLSSNQAVREYAITGEYDRLVYLLSEPHDLSRYLLTLRDEAELVVRMPMEHTGDGGLRGTVIGDDAALGRAIDALPAAIDFEVESVGEYQPDAHDAFSSLTDRQREILSTAIRAGYYESPRQASQRDVAAALDIAPGTVSEHLRRIEATVFAHFTLPRARAESRSELK